MSIHVISSVAELEASVVAGTTNPGDEIHLRGGNYSLSKAGLSTGSNNPNKGVLQVGIKGNPNEYITIRSYPGEHAWIQGGIEIWENVAHDAGYIIFRDLEIAPIPTTRHFATKTAVDYPCCFGGDASHIKLINCYLHDGQSVFPMPIYEGDWEVHGCIISNPGFYTDDDPRNRDYCIYAHNAGITTRNQILINKNAFITPFGSWGTCLWSDGGVTVQDFLVEDNAFFEAGLLIASNGGITRNNVFQRNYGFSRSNQLITSGGKPVRLGNADDDTALDNTVLNNYWVARDGVTLMSMYQQQCNIQNNTFIHMHDVANAQLLIGWYPTTHPDLGIVINNNTYYNAGNLNRFAFDVGAGSYRTFANWKAINGWDTNSTHTAALPTTNITNIINNNYEIGRGFVVIYNWEALSNVNVDLSSLNIPDNARCRCRNCANYSEYFDFTYDVRSPTLLIPMGATDWTLGMPTAYDSPITWPYTNPVPDYGIFLIEVLSSMSRSSKPKRKLYPNPYARHGLGGIASLRRTI